MAAPPEEVNATSKSYASITDQESETDVETQPNDKKAENLKAENSNIKEVIEEMQKQLADERKKNEDNMVQIESLKERAKIFEDHSVLLAYELREMTVDRNSLLNALEGKHEKIKTIEAKCKAKIKKIADQHELKLYDEQVKSYRLHVQNKNLMAELDQIKSEMEDQKLQLIVAKCLNSIVNDVESAIYHKEVKSIREHIQQLQFKLVQTENEKELRSQQEDKIKEEYQKVLNQFQMLQQQRERLENDNTRLNNTVLMMRQENTDAHEKFLEEQTDRINAKMSFVAQIEQLEENCAGLKTMNTKLTKESQCLKSDVERKKQENDGLIGDIQVLRERVEEKENLIEELKANKGRGCLRKLVCWK